MLKRLSFAALFVLLSPSVATATPTFPAKVVHISDGDTITVLRDQQQIKIRLHGIDCPERGQPWGTRAKQFTADLVGMKTVMVQPMDMDRYGRLVAVVSSQETGKSLNLELIRAGLAWWYRKYAPGDKVLEKAEDEARVAQIRPWADPRPDLPWKWISGQRTAVNPMADPPFYHPYP